MLMVISPAKILDYESPPTTERFTLPAFLDQAEALIHQLRELSPPQVAQLMGLSDRLGNLNFGRYLNWSQPFTQDNAKQALLAFKGAVYLGIDAQSLSEADLLWAQDHLRMLSGLYGLLRPLDLMQPYRLEMGAPFVNSRGKNLYEFWGEKLTAALNAELDNEPQPVLVNLASNEYFKALQENNLEAEVITPVFKDWKSGKYKVIVYYAKRARGMMARYIIDNRLVDPEAIKDFEGGGYRYNPSMSSAREWVFIRRSSE